METPFQKEQKMLGAEAEVRRQEAMARIQDLMKKHQAELSQAIDQAFAEIVAAEEQEQEQLQEAA